MKKLDRFILRDILSDGPAGTVYRADEILPGDNRRTVALKVLPPIEGAMTGETPAEARFFGEVQVGKGLAAMHALKPPLIHQDLKPANVLVDGTGNYKITDFSLATVTAANR